MPRTKKNPELTLLNGQRQSSETDKAVIACNDFLRLGAGRTFPRLLELYTTSHKDAAPTQSMDTLRQWSSHYDWPARAAMYDGQWEIDKDAARRAVMEAGLALDYERVMKLKRLADFLESQLYEQDAKGVHHNVWLPDYKQVADEKVKIERFNGAILSEFRATLDDIAKEAGDRRLKQDTHLTGSLELVNADTLAAIVNQRLAARPVAQPTPSDPATEEDL